MYMKTAKKNFMTSGILFISFIVFTLTVVNSDVKPIGPEQSMVGWAAVNQFIFEKLGTSQFWYQLTGGFGMLAILVALSFGMLGFVQLRKRGSFLRVDCDILLLGGFYVTVMLTYILFEMVTINYRPVILDEGLETSFPSSHTMLVVCIVSTAIFQFHHRIQTNGVRYTLEILSIGIIVLTIVGRLLSGVHWFTDIVGGVLLSAALITAYIALVQYAKSKKQVTNW